MGRDPNEEYLKKLKDKVDEALEKARQNRELKDKASAEQADRLQKADQRRRDWYESYRIQAENSAKIVWDWYQEFISSDSFQKITEPAKKARLSELRISKVISCQVPGRGYGDDLWDERQSLGIDLPSNKLFVDNHVKYGKSHEIKSPQDLLEHVFPPILIAVAETITNKTIWDIIDIK